MKTLLAMLMASATAAAWAGPAPVLRIAQPVPALDEAGLMLLAIVVGGVASWAVKRRNRR
jgi:hypothetical protein